MSLDETITTLADPTRRALLRGLTRKPLLAGEHAGGFAMSRAAICQPARLPKQAGLIRARKNGREQVDKLAPKGCQTVKELIVRLEAVGGFWDLALGAFKSYAEEQEMTIHKSIRVERSPETSFKVFCEDIGRWWPGGFGGRDSKLFLEREVGGRFYERRADGSDYEIGRVTAYEPPSLVAFTWRAPSWEVTTQVEVRFTAEGRGTRVDLVHSGWEQSAKTRDARTNYDSGWETILGHYQAAFAPAA
jgi:uncharacterized protein YndB with AHSA1/START domain